MLSEVSCGENEDDLDICFRAFGEASCDLSEVCLVVAKPSPGEFRR